MRRFTIAITATGLFAAGWTTSTIAKGTSSTSGNSPNVSGRTDLARSAGSVMHSGRIYHLIDEEGLTRRLQSKVWMLNQIESPGGSEHFYPDGRWERVINDRVPHSVSGRWDIAGGKVCTHVDNMKNKTLASCREVLIGDQANVLLRSIKDGQVTVFEYSYLEEK